MPTFHHPKPNEVVCGFELLEKIAVGGFASVWRARNSDGDVVAIKFMLPNKVKDPNVVARFHREARLLTQLHHPNIVEVIDYGVTSPEEKDVEGVPYLAMEFVPGASLDDWFSSREPMSPRHVVEVLIAILEGLKVAHKNGVIHRDLKPDNILLAQTERGVMPKLIDFGICKRLTDSPIESDANILTQTDQVFGTPEYMSPEQVSGDEITQRSDLYSLGIIFYELLSGRRPYKGATALKVMLKHLDDPMPPLPFPYSGTALQDVINKATAKDAGERYGDAEAMQDALRNLPDEAMVDGRAHITWPAEIAHAETLDISTTASTKQLGGPIRSPLPTYSGTPVQLQEPEPEPILPVILAALVAAVLFAAVVLLWLS